MSEELRRQGDFGHLKKLDEEITLVRVENAKIGKSIEYLVEISKEQKEVQKQLS